MRLCLVGYEECLLSGSAKLKWKCGGVLSPVGNVAWKFAEKVAIIG